MILTIPISFFPKHDKLVWHYSTNGMYSVKSGYYVALEKKRLKMNVGESSNAQEINRIYKRIWSLPVPPKVRHFLWRACRNLLPVRMSLCKKGVGRVSLCPICELEDEDIYHALVSCDMARVQWFACPLALRVDGFERGSFACWFSNVAKALDLLQLATAAMVVWGIWNRRNGFVHGEVVRDPVHCMNSSMRLLEDFRLARRFKEDPSPTSA